MSYWLAEKLRGWEERRAMVTRATDLAKQFAEMLSENERRLEAAVAAERERWQAENKSLKDMLMHRIEAEAEVVRGAVAAERERCIACLKEVAADYAKGDRWVLAVELTKKAEAAIRKGE